MHNIREESNSKKIRGKIIRMLMITVIAVSLLFILNSLMSEPADAAGYNTAPPAGQSLLIW